MADPSRKTNTQSGLYPAGPPQQFISRRAVNVPGYHRRLSSCWHRRMNDNYPVQWGERAHPIPPRPPSEAAI